MLYNIGDRITVIVIEPWSHNYGTPVGIVDSFESGKLILKLDKPLKGERYSSVYLKLSPRHRGTSFFTAQENKPFFVNGTLIKKGSDLQEFILNGEIKKTILPGL